MATRIFVGDATAVAQVNTVTVDSFDVNTTYTFTINGKTVSVAGITDVAATAAALEVAFNASTIPEFAEITALDDDVDTITLTADTAGKPFTVTLTVAGGTGAVTDNGVQTANDGPEVWSVANFKDETGDRSVAIPGAGDVVILEDHSGDILYSLDQSGAGTWTSLLIRAGFTGKIGLRQQDTSGVAYDEYRPRYLAADFGLVDIGEGAGDGSSKIRLEGVGTVSSFIVHRTSSSEDSFAAIEVDGAGQTFTIVSILAGSVDFARDDATTGATIGTLVADTTANVRVDENCSVTTVSVQGGTIQTDVALTTLTIEQGIVTHTGGNIGTANVKGGSLLFANEASVTVTAVAMGTGGVLDTLDASAAITLTNIALAPGEQINDPDQHFVLSNPATNPANASLDQLGLNIGRGFTLLWA